MFENLIRFIFLFGVIGGFWQQSPAVFGQVCTPAQAGMISWWRGEGNNLDSRTNINGSLRNGASFAPGKVGQAFSFDGIDDFIDTPHNHLIPAQQNINSVEMWINPEISDGGWFFSRRNPNLAEGFSVFVNAAGNLGVVYGTSGTVSSGAVEVALGDTVNFGEWQHIAVTINTITGVLKLYRNGQEKVLTHVQGNVRQPGTTLNNGNIYIAGREPDGPASVRAPYAGLLDEIGYYYSELTQSQVQAIFNAGTAGKCKPTALTKPVGINQTPAVVGWWAGDGNAGDVAGANTGTLQNGAKFTVGKVGQAFDLDGIDDFVQIANTSSMDVTFGDFSLEFWVNFNSLATDQMLFHKISGSTIDDRQLFVEFKVPNSLRFYAGQSATAAVDLVVPTSLAAGEWNHIVVLRHFQTYSIYLNGVRIGAVGDNRWDTGTGGTAAIGKCLMTACNKFLNGRIDEVTMYNAHLAEEPGNFLFDRVKPLFNAGLAGKLKTVNTPAGFSLFDPDSYKWPEILSPGAVVKTVGDATVTYPGVTSAGFTQQIPLDPALFPPLPAGNHTGLFYDIATTATFSGNPTLCFNLPTFSAAEFTDMRILKFENGAWRNRTDLNGSIHPVLCSTAVGSLGPFAIAGSVFTSAVGLGFDVQPSDAQINTPIPPPVRIAFLDQFGDILTTANDAVTISIANNPGGGTLSGTLTRNAVNGVATFDDLSINNAGSGYTLSASAAGLASAQSNAFSITVPPSTVVTNTNDSGAGSLRNAIIASNAQAGVQTISFDIPGAGLHNIRLQTELPTVTDPAIIDATTQPGYSGTPLITIGRTNTAVRVGLTVSAGNSVVKGLFFLLFNTNATNAGLRIDSVGGNIISSNVFNTCASGVSLLSANNLIGGTETGSGNTFVRNTVGIDIFAPNNSVKGNFVGTNPSGDNGVGNTFGISLRGNNQGSIIGGSEPGARNIISGNGNTGIHSLGEVAILGNFVGTDPGGNLQIPNRTGITMMGDRTVIGGVGVNEGNLIAFNTNEGVKHFNPNINSAGNLIRGNSIHSNGLLGIDLGLTGVTLNDPLDPDFGPNGLQNFPVISSAITGGGSVNIQGTLNSKPSQTYTIDFYANSSCDPSGHGEGQTHIGSADVATDTTGITTFNATLTAGVPVGHRIAATATDAQGSTSEFSQCRTATSGLFSISGRITDTGNNPVANIILRIPELGRITVTNGSGDYIFNVNAGSNLTIVPDNPNYIFTPAGRTYANISIDQTNQNFTGMPQGRITARVRSQTAIGTSFALSGVTVALTGAASATGMTDNNGNVTFSNLGPGSYTLTPTILNFTFTPPTTTVDLTGSSAQVFLFGNSSHPGGRIVTSTFSYVFAMNSDGSAKVPIFSGLQGSPSAVATISPNGTKVVFDNISSAGPTIRTINSDGSGLSAFTMAPAFRPFWSPDGSQIVFDGNGLKKINNDGTNLRIITNEIRSRWPFWSPDGTKIVFQSLTPENIYSVSANGGAVTQLTTGGGSHPAFSPDGAKISFLRNGDIFTMNPDGSNAVMIYDANLQNTRPVWAPDGNSILFIEGFIIKRINPDGTGLIPLTGVPFVEMNPFWGVNDVSATGAGSTINVNSGSVGVTFSNVDSAGNTTITPIPPHSAGTSPGGFVIGGMAYEITTTAGITPPITVCFNIPTTIAATSNAFNNLSILHNEGGVLVNRTVSRNFATRTICASVTSLSPFALAHEIDVALPSISGVVLDSNNKPLSGVQMRLTGTEERIGETDSDGVFSFVNLTPNGNYNVQPKHPGYLFNEYNQDFADLTGEKTVAFTGSDTPFSISGQVFDSNGEPVSGVALSIEGLPIDPVNTDASGNYSFTDLPADGTFLITPFRDGNSFAPPQMLVSPLTANASDVNFTAFAPTVASAAVSGRVLTADGRGIYRVFVSMTDESGDTRGALTNPFGYYKFDGVPVGKNYVFAITSRHFRDPVNPILRYISGEVNDLNFTVPVCPKNLICGR